MSSIILATSNRGKVKEISEIFSDYEVIPYTQLIEAMPIEEDASTFKENALIKARAIYQELGSEGRIVMADDSGISVAVLGGMPGVCSARFAGEGAGDADNRAKMVEALKIQGVKTSPAFYTAAIAIMACGVEYTVHGWMHGTVTIDPRGEGGFGYDPLFIPSGYTQTLGELPVATKQKISHRAKALELAAPIIDMLMQRRCRA